MHPLYAAETGTLNAIPAYRANKSLETPRIKEGTAGQPAPLGFDLRRSKAMQVGFIADTWKAVCAAVLADDEETHITQSDTGIRTRRRDDFAYGRVVIEIDAYEDGEQFTMSDLNNLNALHPKVTFQDPHGEGVNAIIQARDFAAVRADALREGGR